MATESGQTVSFANVDVVATGAIPFRVDAFDDGTSINIVPQGDRNGSRKGNDGIAVFVETVGTSVIVTLTLMEISESNEKLSAWLASGITQHLKFSERGGQDLCEGLARVRQYPPITKSGAVEVRAWDILIPDATMFVGGRAA
jgi:hypothetical protein